MVHHAKEYWNVLEKYSSDPYDRESYKRICIKLAIVRIIWLWT